MNPLVSAIIPTYNRAALLARALDSVIAQGYRPLEAVVVDDGSTDNTLEIIETYRPRLTAASIDLLFHRQSNGRAPKARNTAMKEARGSLFAFLDSDDLWRPPFISTLVALLQQHPSAGLAFSGILVIDDEDHVWKVRDACLGHRPPQGVLPRPFDLILRHMPLQTSGVMVRREVIEAVGDFDLTVPVVEDWDLWYRIARRYDFAYTLAGLACNRSHPRNLPKFDCVALGSSLRMNLKHLPEVTDPCTRRILLDRIHRQFTLLQEELLRQGGRARRREEHWGLLRHELAPRTPRFGLGAIVTHLPAWAGQSYARVIRLLGGARRAI